MRQLLQVLLIVIFAVAITLFAQSNTAKVVLLLSNKRIELSLNLAIILSLLGFFLFHYALLALRFSAQITSRFRGFFSNRSQKALLQANINGFLAWVTEDEPESHRALQQAISTGLETDLSHFIRAMYCLQTNRLDEAEHVLNDRDEKSEQYVFAERILRIKILLAKSNAATAMGLLDEFDVQAAKLPIVRKLRLLALVKLHRWSEALSLVDALLDFYPQDLVLAEQAGEIFTQTHVFDKAIAQFERLYTARAAAQYALKLERLYSHLGQADKAEHWKSQTESHL
jgi:HemY protein